MGYYCPEGSVSSTQYQCATADATVLGIPTSDIPPTNVWTTATQDPLSAAQVAIAPVPLAPSLTTSGYLSSNIAYKWHTVQYHNATGDVSVVLTATAMHPNQLFCLAGVGSPLTVFPGYYSFGNNKTTRYKENLFILSCFDCIDVVYMYVLIFFKLIFFCY